MDEPRFVANPRDRCYLCKGMVLDAVRAVAVERGCEVVLDGANRDDLGDERPGMRAAAERGVRHPLLEAGLGKREVRRLARALGLAVWDAPSQACLASRIPYGDRITLETLRAHRRRGAGAAHSSGTVAVACAHTATSPASRCRSRTSGARPAPIAQRSRAACAPLGFIYVALDLDGLRTGSMNEAPAVAGAGASAAGPAPAGAGPPPGAADVVA